MAKKRSNVYFNILNVEDNFEQEETIVSEEPANDNEVFFSIVGIKDRPMKEDEESESKETLSGQITMFADEETVQEDLESDDVFKATAITEDITVIEDVVEEIEEIEDATIIEEELEEITQEFFIEEVVRPAEETEEVIENAFIEEYAEEVIEDTVPITEEPIIEEAIEEVIEETVEETVEEPKQNLEEEMLVSLLETNMLDQEVTDDLIIEEESNETEETSDIFSNLPDFKAIKKQKSFENFETPYVYHGKNGDRIRYRLALPTDIDAKRNRTKKATLGWIFTIALALLLAIFIRMFVFVVATVDGPSMQPTLATQDRLFVTKFTYTFTDVKRGDVVICRYNTVAYPDMYVKRVIGLPGETISIMDGIVYINGTALDEDYTLPSTPYDRYYNMDAIYIPTGYVFVMGDNRNNSADSRMESVGPISMDNIIGKAQARIFPFSTFTLLEENN